MTGFGSCHFVQNQSKLEENIVESMKRNFIQFSKITSLEAFDKKTQEWINIISHPSYEFLDKDNILTELLITGYNFNQFYVKTGTKYQLAFVS